MKNQNNNRKKTHTTYSITNTHTHINIDKYTQKTERTGQFAFWSSFLCPNLDGTCISPLVSPERSLDSPKTTPKCPEKPARTCLSPLGFPKKEPGQPQNHPQPKKKKSRKKKNSQNNSAPILHHFFHPESPAHTDWSHVRTQPFSRVTRAHRLESQVHTGTILHHFFHPESPAHSSHGIGWGWWHSFALAHMFKALRNGLLRYILYTCPNL